MQKKFSKRRMVSFFTPFQKRIYDATRKIPRGKTSTYKEIAFLSGSPGAWRAVGNFLNKNRDPEVPCHRVVRSGGKIGGFRDGQERKIKLLKGEGVLVRNKRVVL